MALAATGGSDDWLQSGDWWEETMTNGGFGGLLKNEDIVKRSKGEVGFSLWTSHPKMPDKKSTMVD